jgi:hypothetical protein
MPKHFRILCDWDREARVWYVAESDVPGLSLEAATQQVMTAKLRQAVPELLELNGLWGDGGPEEVPMSLLYQREVSARRRSA